MYPFGIKEYFEEKSQEFYLFIVPYHAANFEKKSSEWILRYGLVYILAIIGLNCPFGPEDFLGNFNSMIFLYLLCPIIEKSLNKFFCGDFVI